MHDGCEVTSMRGGWKSKKSLREFGKMTDFQLNLYAARTSVYKIVGLIFSRLQI